jgi:hypothetical protein
MIPRRDFGPTTPKRARRPFDASVDHTEARKDAGGAPAPGGTERRVLGWPEAEWLTPPVVRHRARRRSPARRVTGPTGGRENGASRRRLVPHSVRPGARPERMEEALVPFDQPLGVPTPRLTNRQLATPGLEIRIVPEPLDDRHPRRHLARRRHCRIRRHVPQGDRQHEPIPAQDEIDPTSPCRPRMRQWLRLAVIDGIAGCRGSDNG